MRRTLLSIPVIAVLAITLSACTSGAVNTTSSPSPTVTSLSPSQHATQAHQQAAQDAKDAAQSLTSLPKNPKKYLSTDAIKQLQDAGLSPQDAFPSGTVIKPAEASWHPVGPGEGQMDTVLTKPDGTQQKYIAQMVKTKGVWQLLETVDPS